jgi:LysR family transcriptional regulator (chromosome initiation inhibitor)
MMMLQPNLRTFMAVAEFSNLSAAAKRLHLTQTGATQRIKKLERELGVTLFLRSRTGMKLTPEGRALARYCSELVKIEGQALAGLKFTGKEQTVELCVAGPVSLIAGRVLPKCQALFSEWQNLELRFMVDTNANRLNLLKSGAADLAFVFPHEVTAELDSRLLRPVEYVLVAAANWKKRPLPDILASEPLMAFHREDSMGIDYLAKFNLLENLRNKRRFANENVVLIRSIELGLGFGVLPKEIASIYAEQGSLVTLNQGRALKVPFALAWYPRPEMPKYFAEAIKALT